MDITEFQERTALRAQINAWDTARQRAFRNIYNGRSTFADGLDHLGISVIAGVSNRVETWGRYFPFPSIAKIIDNDNHKPVD